MRFGIIPALIALNILLLVSLLFHNVFTHPASAQMRQARPSEYLMIPGEVQGGTGGVIFIVDTKNNLLSVRNFANGRLEDMPPIPLARVFKNAK